MKVYTKTGDTGSTSLIGGRRVAKNHPCVDAYGTVDELNAHIGVVKAYLCEEPPMEADAHRHLPAVADLVAWLHQIQEALMILSSHLANDHLNRTILPPLKQESTKLLEHAIDYMQMQLPSLQSFVIPGPPPAAAHCHVARTVCRRAERSVVALGGEAPPEIVVYLNRLSDFLFVLSRYLVEVLE